MIEVGLAPYIGLPKEPNVEQMDKVWNEIQVNFQNHQFYATVVSEAEIETKLDLIRYGNLTKLIDLKFYIAHFSRFTIFCLLSFCVVTSDPFQLFKKITLFDFFKMQKH